MKSTESMPSAGARFWRAMDGETPLLLPGAVNAYCAKTAARAGFSALYLSGGGVAATMGYPDLAVITLSDVVAETSRICAVTELPLLVDADTGFGHWLSISRTVKSLQQAGAAGMHLEDQQAAKRCGHRPNKSLVSAAEMADRIRAAVDARSDDNFILMARTDSLASESLSQALERGAKYIAAGADMLFVEAATTLEQYRQFRQTCGAPILANITEFGQTPLFTADELATAGVDIMLFPLSAFRAMNAAADSVYRHIRKHGGQSAIVDKMQTREELYDILGYYSLEKKMDSLFADSPESVSENSDSDSQHDKTPK